MWLSTTFFHSPCFFTQIVKAMRIDSVLSVYGKEVIGNDTSIKDILRKYGNINSYKI